MLCLCGLVIILGFWNVSTARMGSKTSRHPSFFRNIEWGCQQFFYNSGADATFSAVLEASPCH
eukprot:6474357-Amphidinium_carterae.1